MPNSPGLYDAHRYYHAGRLDLAEAECRRLLSREPLNADALNLLGAIALRTHRLDDAVDLLRRAIASRPAFADAYNNLAVALEARGQLVKAENGCWAALGLDPGHVGAWDNLGNILIKQGRTDEAADAYRAALRLRPTDPIAHAGLGFVLLDQCRTGEAIDLLRRACELQPESAAAGSDLLYSLHYDERQDAEALYREHVEWGRRWGSGDRLSGRPHGLKTRATGDADRGTGLQPVRATPELISSAFPCRLHRPDAGVTPGTSGDAARPLRIGYLSADFRDHTVPRFISPALERHDRGAFEVFLYSDVTRPDATTERLQRLGHVWRECALLSDEQLSQLIRGDRIDILVDLRGHGGNNRLRMFALKPARIQVNMVGYFNTTGLAAMDYRITDAAMDPPGETEQYNTETLVRLAPSCWCYRPDDDAPNVAPPPAESAGYVTFGSLNKVAKISPTCARLWAAALDAVPRSRLLLSATGGDARGTLRARLAEMGLPAERVEVIDKAATRRAYLERYAGIDVALETFPFNGITTTCDALWMGVPVVSLAGVTSVSRAGRSILSAAGLSDLAGTTPDAFVATAAALANNPRRRSSLRSGMRQRLGDSALCDAGRFTGGLEAAYQAMWRRR